MKVRIKISGVKDTTIFPRYPHSVAWQYANLKMKGASSTAVVAQLRKLADTIEKTAVG